MRQKIANKLKVFLETGIALEHMPRVATNGMDASLLKVMVLVQEPSRSCLWDGALVNDGLAKVLTCWFQFSGQFIETISGRE